MRFNNTFLVSPLFLVTRDTHHDNVLIQSTLVISNSKRLSEILRDIRTSKYQICRIEEKIIRTITFNKYLCNWTLKIWRYIENIVEKRRNCSLFFYLLLDFHV